MVVGLAEQTISRLLLQWSGRLLLSAGVILVCLLSLRLVREEMDRRILPLSPYLLAVHTLQFELPAATPLPSTTPTPVPSATPLPSATPSSTPSATATPPSLPSIRISIPSIGLNASIAEISPTRKFIKGEEKFTWEPLPHVVAHYDSSGHPGEGTNIVLTGHNNTLGKVFKDLDQLTPGSEIFLFTEMSEFHYQVQKKYLIPYMGVEEEGDAALQAFSAPTPSETVTLISCWPYATNSHRIVIIAVPIPGGDPNGL